MKVSPIYFFLVSLVFSLTGFAQTNSTTGEVNGTVKDKSDQALQLATVTLKGTTVGTLTDESGGFSLEGIPVGSQTLQIAYAGFEMQEIVVDVIEGRSVSVEVIMQESISELDDVLILGESEAQKLERSAQAVNVIDLKNVKLATLDLGEVLARTEGVAIQRAGGLGSGTRVSMNGLTDDQIRIFIDGLPLELAGYPFGVANVPVSLIERVEVYKGVVPVRFGADALGGSINLVTPEMGAGLFGSASYQIGSFGTHRVSADVGFRAPKSGVFVRGSGFYDFARNNYNVDVTAADERGQSFDITVPRFHDRYRADGGNFTIGVKDKRWADELSVTGYIVDFARQVQHNNSMTQLPFGKPESLGNSIGINTTYRVGIGDNFSLDFVGGYSRGERSFVDTSSCRFNWLGECFLRLPNEQIGEAINGGTDRVVEDEDIFVRASAEWKINLSNRIRITTAPTYNSRTGDDRLRVQGVDLLNTESSLETWVSGVEHQFGDSDKRLENRLFFKHYRQTGVFQLPDRFNRLPEEDRSITSLFGYGNVTSFRWTERLTLKVSYEYATRLPRRDEVFGDGLEITANPLLKPERSHNANLELNLKSKIITSVPWRVRANGFLRITQDLITLVPTFAFLNSYFNVFDATSVGAEVSGRVSLFSERLTVDANTTYQSFRNLSDEGLFRDFKGDRIPNRPYFFANANARYGIESPIKSQDRIDIFANTRFVYQFFRSWESAGNLGNSSVIPTQNIYGAGVSYTSSSLFGARCTLTAEVQNLTDQVVFDFFGVQRPGRAYFFKLTTQF